MGPTSRRLDPYLDGIDPDELGGEDIVRRAGRRGNVNECDQRLFLNGPTLTALASPDEILLSGKGWPGIPVNQFRPRYEGAAATSTRKRCSLRRLGAFR